jgi:rubrerythrin
MDFRSNPGEVLDAMAKNEEAVSRLYQAYADRFPDQKAFWSGLVAEETSHAGWIRGLQTKMREGSLAVNRDRFKIQPVRGFSAYLERELVSAREPGMSPINALSVALYIEESLIEQRYFEVFAADAPELKRILADLAAATKTHLEKVREEWGKQRPSTSR